MSDKIKTILIITGVLGILIFGYLIYQKVTYTPVIDNEVTVDEIGDKKTPDQVGGVEEVPNIKPDPITYEEEEDDVVETPDGPELGMNEIRRDPIISNDNQPDNNDRIFNVGDIEEITQIIEIIDEDTKPVEDEFAKLEKERKRKEREERNIGYVDGRLDSVSITSRDGSVNLANNVSKKGIVIVYWTTKIDGGTDTMDKWVNYYNLYKDEVDFMFVNRGFEVENFSNIIPYIEERDWDIPLYMDSMLSFAIVQDINQPTEGFFINKDGFLMGREKSKDLTGVESSIKGLTDFHDKNKGVWDY